MKDQKDTNKKQADAVKSASPATSTTSESKVQGSVKTSSIDPKYDSLSDHPLYALLGITCKIEDKLYLGSTIKRTVRIPAVAQARAVTRQGGVAKVSLADFQREPGINIITYGQKALGCYNVTEEQLALIEGSTIGEMQLFYNEVRRLSQ